MYLQIYKYAYKYIENVWRENPYSVMIKRVWLIA